MKLVALLVLSATIVAGCKDPSGPVEHCAAGNRVVAATGDTIQVNTAVGSIDSVCVTIESVPFQATDR